MTSLTKETKAFNKIIKQLLNGDENDSKESIGVKEAQRLIPFNIKLKYFTFIVSKENWVESKTDVVYLCTVSIDLHRLNIFLLDSLNREKLLEILKIKDEFNLLTPLLYQGIDIAIPIFCKEEISRLYSKLFSPTILELLYIHES